MNAGKTAFIFLTKKEEFSLATSVSIVKKAHNYTTEKGTNYDFLPINIGVLTSANGKHIEFSGNTEFIDFYKVFNQHLKYQLYIEKNEGGQIVFTGKDKTKVLGAIFSVGSGHLIALPYIDYDYDKFITKKTNKNGVETNHWTPAAIKFGDVLTGKLIQIDNDLRQNSEKTPPPEWVQDKKFFTEKENALLVAVDEAHKKISEIKQNIEKFEKGIADEQVLKGLLYEQGKPLEAAVTKALNILGYSAEGYDDGTLELDQIILSPEGYRYIGECEGKDNKDIDVTKFRQLAESMNADFAREEVSEKAFGILFGNPQRLLNPAVRTLDFTQKCKIGAARDKIVLIRTSDLFTVAKYVSETEDEVFKKACREAIHSALGTIVIFPTPQKYGCEGRFAC